MRLRPLIFLDIESTGLQIQKSEIIEVGALKTEQSPPFKIVEEFCIKVKPKRLRDADKNALKIVGYSQQEWKNGVNIAQALIQLDEFSQEGILVGYNVSFDWAMLDKFYYAQGRQDPFYYHRIDVMAIAFAKLFSRRAIRRFSLGEVCKYFKIDRAVKHRALDDALATYQVFKKLMST